MNVVLILADGLQVAALGAYGNEWIATPNLDHLAGDSVVFDQHFADVPAQSPLHGRHAFPALARPEDDFAPAGLRIIELPSLRPPWNAPAELLAEQFEDWESDEEPEPWLDPQPQRLGPGDEIAFARLQRTYSAVVRQFDEQLGKILRERMADDLLILTCGRGQNLGEHGLIGDFRPWLHEEMVHLPLVIHMPGSEQAGRRVAHLTQSVDLAPTILDAQGLAKPDDWHGQSLLPLCRGDGPVRPYLCMGMKTDDVTEFALQTADLKIIMPKEVPPGDLLRGPMFFVKPDDRWEVNNLWQPNIDYAEQLEQTLQKYVEASRQPGPLPVPPLPQLEGSSCPP
jgi:arylsulfatase A-like enzyme